MEENSVRFFCIFVAKFQKMTFREYINQCTEKQIITKDWEEKYITQKMVSKGEIILKDHSFTTKIFFIERGFARTFYQKDDKIITHSFLNENTIIAPTECIFQQKTTPYGIEIIQDSSVHYFDYQSVKFVEDYQTAQTLLLSNALLYFSERLKDLQFHSAKERYQNLLKNYPEILQKAPMGYIASYLGISQPTLSVIRSQVKDF